MTRMFNLRNIFELVNDRLHISKKAIPEQERQQK